MREIKFRAWEIKENKMWDVFRLDFSPDQYKPHTIIVGTANEGSMLSKPLHNLSCDSPDFILMQYTGLKDKNGVEAYHKDICIGNWPYADKCLIEWDDKRCGFYFRPIKPDGTFGKAAYDKGYKLNAYKYEIIGNEPENPELLTGI